MEGLSDLHGPELFVHPTSLFRRSSSARYQNCQLTKSQCYPETSNLTLEEIDFLFTEDGADGLRKFGRKSQPVQESLRPIEDISQDAEKARASLAGEKSEHIDHIDDKAS